MKNDKYQVSMFLKRFLIILVISVSLIAILTFLGYLKLWIFTERISDNGFIVGVIVLLISGIALKNYTGNGGFYTVSRMNNEYDDKHKYIGFALYFSAGITLMSCSALLLLINV